MERFLLIASLAILSGCQIASFMPADLYEEPEPIIAIKSDAIYESVWDRIALNSTIQNQELDEETLQYLNAYLASPEQLNKLLVKGEYFIFFVLEQLEKYDLPPELALLPYIESNYDPFSISTSGAMGLWQFMPD